MSSLNEIYCLVLYCFILYKTKFPAPIDLVILSFHCIIMIIFIFAADINAQYTITHFHIGLQTSMHYMYMYVFHNQGYETMTPHHKKIDSYYKVYWFLY